MYRRGLFHWILALATASTAAPAFAAVKPHTLFSDHMVLQQGVELNVWGTADPEEVVQLSLTHPALGDKPLEKMAKADAKGNWLIKLPKLKATEEKTGCTLTIKGSMTEKPVEIKDVLVGEVWVCSGQSNMEWPLRASAGPEEAIKSSGNPMLRLYTVPKRTSTKPEADVMSQWTECKPETTPNFSAVGYYFGDYLQKNLKTPVGLIHTSWGGTPAEAWTSRETLESNDALKHYTQNLDKRMKAFDADKAKADYEKKLEVWKVAAEKAKEEKKPIPKRPQSPNAPGYGPNDATSLYNAMIHPLLQYGVKGAVWYQGESNAGRAFEYRTLMPAMIEDWRKNFNNPDLSFFMVQLAPFQKIQSEPMESAWAELREAQLLATKKLQKVGMAVITDVGEENDIHPRKKQPVGERLAIAALGVTYGKVKVFTGPEFKSLKVDGNKAILDFTSVGGGLVAKGEKLTGFTVAGEDKKFHNATATIQGDQVIVSSDKVEKPVAVRYGWANFPVVNFWNKEGLPATPFRTDDFPITTMPKK